MPNYNKKKLHAVSRNDARPECMAVDEAETKGKRKRVIGLTVFQREFRKNSSKFCDLPMSNMSLINAAREAYSSLPVSEKQKYEKIASEENRHLVASEGHNWQMDQFGRKKLSLMKESERYRRWDGVDSVEHMKLLLSGSAEEIAKRSFVVIRASFYIGDPGHKRPGVDLIVPAEVTLIRFSLFSGIEDVVTLLPAATDVPAFLKGSGVESEEIHGLNMLDNGPIGTTMEKLSPNAVVNKIRDFMAAAYTPDRRPPPVFALGKQYLDVIPLGLKYIYDAAKADCPFLLPESNYGYCYMLEDFTELLHKRGRQLRNESVQLTLDRLDPNKLCYNSYKEAPTNLRIRQCCEVHLMMDRSEDCTQTAAFCHVWWAIHSSMGFYNIAITEKHFPPTLLTLWDFEGRDSASNSERSTPDDTPPRPTGGRGRGVTVADEPPRPRPPMSGRGRGRGLRGRLPTNLD